ncbi:hypothetical protein RJ639_007288 [Escallonia herrerae]|uniref:Uncharacterized protein n=1 Tax=Escallonia herrerae TaxID=1293975 RepID=A0AA89AU59_9ASTE|nr:hypothetical protein RJ639_007288 [Escallonia herrerae]
MACLVVPAWSLGQRSDAELLYSKLYEHQHRHRSNAGPTTNQTIMKHARGRFLKEHSDKGYTKISKTGDHGEPASGGFVPLYVGEEGKKYIIPVSYFSSVWLEALLHKYEEEARPNRGPLTLPCSRQEFESMLNLVKVEREIMGSPES